MLLDESAGLGRAGRSGLPVARVFEPGTGIGISSRTNLKPLQTLNRELQRDSDGLEVVGSSPKANGMKKLTFLNHYISEKIKTYTGTHNLTMVSGAMFSTP